MTLISAAASQIIKSRIRRIGHFMKNPHEVQQDWFHRLITTAAKTAWGKKYGYDSIRSYQDYADRVPISDYESFKTQIARVRQGEQNILWPSPIHWFARSSGTTGDKSKFIPVSQESLKECHYKGAMDLVSLYLNHHPESGVFRGKGLIMGGSSRVSSVNNESYYEGDLSAVLIQNLPFYADFFRIPNRSIALMSEWETKIERIAETTLHRNVTSLSGVPSWTLLLLKRILEISGKTSIHDVWPELEVFFHGGVSFLPYKSQYDRIIPAEKMNYVESYNASEGFFGIQDLPDNDSMLLMLDYGIFYEFFTTDQLQQEQPRAKTLDEIVTGENYAMVITTNAGLWRYLIGDTVIFTSLDPYRIQVSGRTKSFINAVGEELIVDNAEKAMQIACQKSLAVINEYTAGPVYFNDSENAAHEWLLEFEKPPADFGEFCTFFDEALKSVNSDYEAKRHQDMVLRKPIIRMLPNGTFYRWMKKRGKLGGQNKVPRLSNNRDYVEEILKIVKE
ncbi:MAG: GH3 auxin-responsive promoter family protein [Lentimicrobiaceae bacterium]|nr:GH3 auxin-responsive promoter family protein [Lentimicrobiaceae bacterium]